MKSKRIAITSVAIFIIGFLVYALFGQEYLYARSFASELYEYPLPDKTKVTERNFDYGVLFGGGPSGSGGYPTVASYIEIESELSEKELYDYYNKGNVFSAPGEDAKRVGFEIYFAGHYHKQIEEGKVWFEGDIQPGELGSQKNDGKPIKAIVQIRAEFSYPFFIDFF
ncbi:hypothetical protein [Lysinibacillus odysseyi]|uniref:Uncharacterized protein n=1 Tax=Lysinibacillus odysseyi 34hs-1 = NBRC 100172 TaxID=1220589 RepID=A0A0A3IL54_9BACI|nr:hypothetical protein [Lysinibacillus odysseyi]KGR85501.1 hypothetical protein CD32_09815 [Lysinibacillus odysseyi 34hs-1 = NBRC 100172]